MSYGSLNEVEHLQREKMFFEAAALRLQKGGRGGILVIIPLLLIQGLQGCPSTDCPNCSLAYQQVLHCEFSGGRVLLQVEDCPTESVEKLRGEVCVRNLF